MINRDPPAQIDAALRFIPADDRQTWVTIGMALKAELGNDGFSLWDFWSQTGSTYNERDAQAVWRSFKSGPVQIGTLFHIAQQHGYRPDRQAPARPIPVKKAPLPQKETSAYAAEIWLRADCSDDAVRSHHYVIAKGISHAGGAGRAVVSGRVVGQQADCIIVPIRDIATGKLCGIQCINPEGAKQTFGRVSGNGLMLGNALNKSLRWFIVEGWADAVSMCFHHYNGNAVAFAAFGKGGMEKLAEHVAEVYRPEKIIIVEDAA